MRLTKTIRWDKGLDGLPLELKYSPSFQATISLQMTLLMPALPPSHSDGRIPALTTPSNLSALCMHLEQLSMDGENPIVLICLSLNQRPQILNELPQHCHLILPHFLSKSFFFSRWQFHLFHLTAYWWGNSRLRMSPLLDFPALDPLTYCICIHIPPLTVMEGVSCLWLHFVLNFSIPSSA